MEFLLIKQVQQIFACESYETARKKVRLVKDAHGITNRRITLDELCIYYDLEKEKVKGELNLVKKRQ